MIVINYSTAFKALNGYIQCYNKEVDRNQTVKPSMILTAQELIKIYGVSLAKANSIQTIDKSNLPSLKTNNSQLAKRTQASTRTIQRHIKRLLEAGIITEKIFHGSNASFELFINEKILLATCRLSVNEAKMALELKLNPILQSTNKQEVENTSRTFCPHTDTRNNSYKANNVIKDVDNLSIGSILQSAGYDTGNSSKRCSAKKQNDLNVSTGNVLTGYTGGKVQEKNQDTGGKVQEKRAEADKKSDLKARKQAEARCTSLNFYVKMLWTLAQNVLYRGVYLTDRQVEIAQKLLYRWYEPVSTANLANVHQHYVERIDLVRKYIEKDPQKRFVQLPNRYFDPYNSNGFTGTKKWHKIHQQRQREVQVKLIVHAQIKRFLNNEMKEAAKRKPPLELYRDCEQRIGKLGDPVLLEQFHSAVLNPTVNRTLYAN